MAKPEKMEFSDISFVHGTRVERTIYNNRDGDMFTYDPKEWTVDLTLTKKVKALTPGFYAKFRDGKLCKVFGAYAVHEYVAGETLPTLIDGWEWRRVTFEVIQ